VSGFYSVKECLRGYTNAALKVICERWKLAAESKPTRIRAIEKVLRDPFHVAQVLKRLDPAAVRVLHLVATRGTADLADLLSVPGLLGDGRTHGVVQEVTQQGLALVCPHDHTGAFSFADLADKYSGNGHKILLAVPDSVAKHLPPMPALGVTLRPGPTNVEPDTPASSDKATAAFLETLRVVDVLGPRLTTSGDLHRSDAKRAQELAETIARNSPSAMAATKKALWGALEMGLTDACRAGARHLVSMWGHPDQTEGPAAFAQRREPEWLDLEPIAGEDHD